MCVKGRLVDLTLFGLVLSLIDAQGEYLSSPSIPNPWTTRAL
jgi:hypothetical protein